MSSSKVKVLIVGHFPYPKGLASSHYIFYIRKILKKSRYSVSIYTFSSSFDKFKSLNRLVKLPFLVFSYFCFNVALLSNILYSRFLGSKVIIYYYGRSKVQFKLLVIFKKLSRSKIVIHISEYEPCFYPSKSLDHKQFSKLYDDFATYADKFVFISSFVKGYFLSKHNHKALAIRPEAMYVLPPITDSYKILSSDALIRKKKYILYSANLTEYTNDAIFIIKAFSHLTNENVDLLLIGRANAKTLQRLEKYVEILNISKRVFFISEYLSNKNLFSHLRGASALLAPLDDNLRNSSRFPYKLAQYMSSGSLVITSPVGEVGDVLKGTNTVLFSQYDTYDFARVLDANLPKKNNQLSLNSINFAKKYFDYRNYISSFQSFLKY